MAATPSPRAEKKRQFEAVAGNDFDDDYACSICTEMLVEPCVG